MEFERLPDEPRLGIRRLSYNFDNRYYLTVNMRVDGSSNFAKNNRVGYFPSLAAAWRIDKEGFMKEVKAINNFKIRARRRVLRAMTGSLLTPTFRKWDRVITLPTAA